ncbi:MAG TPA: hypothetical protein VKE22_08770 [Haliangiales bacterium]|nr:hypothetical protein [Haliangiales bacterium]
MGRRGLVILFAAVLAGACGKSDDAQAQAIVAAWQKAGLEPSALEPIDGKPFDDGKCRTGSVGGIDVTMCEYKDADAAKRAEAVGLTKIGDATGVARAEGRVMLVLADRRGHDPNGRTINRILKVFSETK